MECDQLQLMNKAASFLYENIRWIVVGAIAVVSVILIIVIYTLICSGSNDRKIEITDISGSAFVLKDDGQINADRHTKLESGDVIITSSDSSLVFSVDGNKKIYVEPESTLYIYYTDASDKGSIVVNLTEGAVTCRLDSKLKRNSAFEVRTPNAVIGAKGTVFRTQFDYYESYKNLTNAMLTEIQAVENEVTVQLYDNAGQPEGELMLLTEKKSAQLLTSDSKAQYNYLNQDTDINTFSKSALESLIRVSAERMTAYSLTELNAAYQYVLGQSGQQESVYVSTQYETAAETEETSSVRTVTSVTRESRSESAAESSLSESASAETTVTAAETTVPAAEETSRTISVTSPTTVIMTVSPPDTSSDTTVTTEVTASQRETGSQVTTAIPPIQNATTASSVTTESETEAQTDDTTSQTSDETETTTSVPWWEIINSSALTRTE
ncbi:MAG: FecR domain-containing protein [Huintestinicola sp.]